MQFTPTGNKEGIRVAGFLQLHRNVRQQFLFKAFAQLAAGDELAFLSGKRRSVDLEIHGQGGFIHGGHWQRFGPVDVGERYPDTQLLDPVDQHDVTCQRLRLLHSLDPVKPEDLVDLGFLGQYLLPPLPSLPGRVRAGHG